MRKRYFASTVAIATMMLVALSCQMAFALTLTRGVATPLSSVDGTLECYSVVDSVTLGAAFTSPDTITSGLNIATKRVQYDFNNALSMAINSWTLYYDKSIGDKIIAAWVPLGYIRYDETYVTLGGEPFGTLLNSGYGTYHYNSGAKWTIDYQADHITFKTLPDYIGLPSGSIVGATDVVNVIPTFVVQFDPSLSVIDDCAIALPVGANVPVEGKVKGPGPVVPEPASILGLGLPVFGLALRMRKRK